MSDFMAKLIDRRLDKLPKNLKWYLLVGGIIIVVFYVNKGGGIPNEVEYHHVVENVGAGGSGNNVSGMPTYYAE